MKDKKSKHSILLYRLLTFICLLSVFCAVFTYSKYSTNTTSINNANVANMIVNTNYSNINLTGLKNQNGNKFDYTFSLKNYSQNSNNSYKLNEVVYKFVIQIKICDTLNNISGFISANSLISTQKIATNVDLLNSASAQNLAFSASYDSTTKIWTYQNSNLIVSNENYEEYYFTLQFDISNLTEGALYEDIIDIDIISTQIN